VRSVDVSADLRQLQSDRSMRDERIHTLGLESDLYPTARFGLSSPIVFSSRPSSGTTVKTTASGGLTLHGVTRSVQIALQARWTPGQIEVVGSLPIQLSDYGIIAPNVGPGKRGGPRDDGVPALLHPRLNGSPHHQLNRRGPQPTDRTTGWRVNPIWLIGFRRVPRLDHWV